MSFQTISVTASATEVDQFTMTILAKTGSNYNDHLQVEFIKYKDELYYIEINPRFWGPFQLAVDHCSKIMDLYLEEWFGVYAHGSCNREITDYYAWYYGAQQDGQRQYPNVKNVADIDYYLEMYDVYNRDDTLDLHKNY